MFLSESADIVDRHISECRRITRVYLVIYLDDFERRLYHFAQSRQVGQEQTHNSNPDQIIDLGRISDSLALNLVEKACPGFYATRQRVCLYLVLFGRSAQGELNFLPKAFEKPRPAVVIFLRSL